jgi:hypothetical protein
MRIIGCDPPAHQQTLAMLDTTTGEVVNRALTKRQRRAGILFSASAAGVCRHRSHRTNADVDQAAGSD